MSLMHTWMGNLPLSKLDLQVVLLAWAYRKDDSKDLIC